MKKKILVFIGSLSLILAIFRPNSLAQNIAQTMGLELEIHKIEWDGLVPALQSGKIDAIIAGMSPTAERKEEIDFTDTYYTSDLVIVVREDSEYANASSLEDFSGSTLTGQINTFHYEVLDQVPNINKETALADFPTMISSTLSGKVDGYISERPGAMAAVAANDSLTYVTFVEGQGFQVNEEDTSIAIGLRKGSNLTEPMNDALAAIPEEQRQDAMEEMVAIQTDTREEDPSFLQTMLGIAKEYGPLFVRGAGVTMFIAIISTILGFIIDLLVQVIRTIPIESQTSKAKNIFTRIVQAILTIYIEVFRGTPMMV